MVEIVGGRILQNAAFGNEAWSIPVSGTSTSTEGFGGTHPPIFIETGFPVIAATVSFEREFGELEYFEPAEVVYTYKDGRSAARIRVRAPIDPTIDGFYVDFGQNIGYDTPFILRFNWMAVGPKRTL